MLAAPEIKVFINLDRAFDGLISKEDVDAMAKNVDKFSLMTYDYSSPQR